MRVVRTRLSYGNIVFIGTWLIGSLLWIVFNSPVSKMRAQLDGMTRTKYSAQGLEWMGMAWDWFPLWVGFLALVFIIARSSAESRRSI